MTIILFDIDGTLVDTDGAGRAAMAAALPAEFDRPRIDHPLTTAGRSDRAIASELFETYGIEDSAEHWERFHNRYISLLEKELPQRKGCLLPGVADLLALIHQREDVAIGLITGNVIRAAQIKLTYFGVGHYFSFGGYGDLHPDRADIARAAVKSAAASLSQEIRPTEVWVIGDTPADVSCARAIGAQVIAVTTGIFSAEALTPSLPDLLLEDLSCKEFLQAKLFQEG